MFRGIRGERRLALSLRFSLRFALLQQIVDAVTVLFGAIWNKVNIRCPAELQAFDEFMANKSRRSSESLESGFAIFIGAKHFDVDANVFQARRYAHFRNVHGRGKARVLQLTREHQADFVANLFRDTFGTMAGDRHGWQPYLNLALQ